MYSGYGFSDFEIGDVNVIKHEEKYHLFHLTLPNHAYIAHAVSEDGLKWRGLKMQYSSATRPHGMMICFGQCM